MFFQESLYILKRTLQKNNEVDNEKMFRNSYRNIIAIYSFRYLYFVLLTLWTAVTQFPPVSFLHSVMEWLLVTYCLKIE